MQNRSLLSESFYADPWTPDTPSEDGSDLWHTKLANEGSKANSTKFENDFIPQDKSFPVHLKPCPELPPPLDLEKGLKRMENKLKRIQRGRPPNKLSSRDIVHHLNSSRDDTSTYTHKVSEPTLTLYTPHSDPQPTHSSILCCWRARHASTDEVVVRYNNEVEVRDTVPLVEGDELLDSD